MPRTTPLAYPAPANNSITSRTFGAMHRLVPLALHWYGKTTQHFVVRDGGRGGRCEAHRGMGCRAMALLSAKGY
jgi:hypothetical protein